ncbi:MAG: EscU/YscU/HrcU family type III secretion system export apparatus switch protein [Myxococcales bacterium]|nr:EscU/YscU/HrcU family type III secretion system export apparatus switch protein [Myxococcales bacterium]
MSDADQGERTFEPTAHRREEFRKQGKFARSRDAAGVAATFCALGALLGSRAAIRDSMQQLFHACFGDLGALSHGQPGDAFRFAAQALLTIAGPASLAAIAASATVGLVQSGLHVNLDALGFKPERLDFISKLKGLVAPKQQAVEMILSLLRIGVVGYVAYRAAIVELPDLLGLARAPVDISIERIVQSSVHVMLSAGAALSVIALADYAQSRLRISKEMKMTRQEVMEETKANEGDQKVKYRIRARARAMARKRALQSVKKADVVVTNPTHVAVALRYDEKDAAPVVVAKGQDDVALRIRAEARKHGIPILENRRLARALDAEVPVGHAVPMAHFAAVARVLAFVYRLRGGRKRGTRRA